MVQYNEKQECPDHDKCYEGWQIVHENLSKILHGLLSFLSRLCEINLVMEFPKKHVSLECCDGIRIPYTDKTSWCVYGGMDVRDVATCLDKKEGWVLGEGDYVVVYDYTGQSWYGL